MSEKPWYVLNVWRRFESIDLEQSATKEVKGFDRKVKTKLDVRKKKIVLQNPSNYLSFLQRQSCANEEIHFDSKFLIDLNHYQFDLRFPFLPVLPLPLRLDF